MNIALSIDEEIVKKVRKIAVDRDTTLTAMVREYLTTVANSDVVEYGERVPRFKATLQRVSRDMGPRSWTRGRPAFTSYRHARGIIQDLRIDYNASQTTAYEPPGTDAHGVRYPVP